VAFERRGKVTLVFMWVGMRVVGGWWVVGWLMVGGWWLVAMMLVVLFLLLLFSHGFFRRLMLF
jgi:hypothetical protein